MLIGVKEDLVEVGCIHPIDLSILQHRYHQKSKMSLKYFENVNFMKKLENSTSTEFFKHHFIPFAGVSKR